ncbi:hypothetical protein [Burkholderia ambifaria]|uniref:hypothetical protein n=1 Tax=Burkholderia ambifaria TaxID=152480 RepID=UPI00158A1FDB|nr:hypothetical protein [Burkholderia ambifaria]
MAEHDHAFTRLHEFLPLNDRAASMPLIHDVDAWTDGARFALAAAAEASLEPLRATLDACARERARLTAAQDLAPADDGALCDVVRAVIRTIDQQLELIATRSTGKRLDKAPVVRSLTHLRTRLERAVAAAPTTAKETSDAI